MHVADTRHIEIVHLHRRYRRDRVAAEAELPEGRLEFRAIARRNDERARAERAPGGFERRLGGLHAHGRVRRAELHQVVVGGVIDDQHRSGAFHAAGGAYLGQHGRHGLLENAFLADRQYRHVAHVLEGPARVVVRAGVGRRKVLHRQIHVSQRAIRLIAAHDVVAGLHIERSHFERTVGGVELEPLLPQLVHGIGRVGLATLRGWDHPRIRPGPRLPLFDGALVLEPIVLEVERLVVGKVLEREEHRRLLDVRVVSRAPLDIRQRRIWTEPLAARGRGRRAHLVVVRAVTLHFVEAADRVLRMRGEEHVIRRPSIVEAVRPHARHATLGELLYIRLRHHPPLRHGDRVDGVVVGTGSGARIQIGDRLVQVVHHLRLPGQEEIVHVLRERQELAHAVAVVVVGHVLAPVHQRQPRRARRQLLVVVVRVDLLLAAVDFDDGRDEGDDVVADLLDEGRLLHHQPIGQLLQHFRAASFRRMNAARQPIHRLRGADQALGFGIARAPWIGERRDIALVLVEIGDRGRIGDRQDHHVTPFFGFPDRPVPGPWRRLGDRFEIAMNVLGVGQFARGADDPTVERERRGDGARRR